jgi:hypothetical protein
MAVDADADADALLCPSAQPDMPEAQLVGVIDRSQGQPRVGYINGRVEFSAVLDELGSVPPLRVLRIAARCQESRCHHFDGAACTLAQRIVEALPEVSAALPPCAIRRTCRWHAEQGKRACLRCPQVITEADVSDVNPRLVAHA